MLPALVSHYNYMQSFQKYYCLSPMQIMSWLMLGHWFFFFFLKQTMSRIKNYWERWWWVQFLRKCSFFISGYILSDILEGERQGENERNVCFCHGWWSSGAWWLFPYCEAYYTAPILDLDFKKYNPTQAMCYYFSKRFAHNPLVTSIF